MNQTLFEKLGGEKTVEKASHLLYVNLMRDNRINYFFENIDLEKQKRKMSAFLTYIFGGPSLYTGRDMRRAHKGAVDRGLNDDHFDAMIDCVRDALDELEISNKTINEVTSTIETHRDDVLNR